MDSLDAFSGAYSERLIKNAQQRRVPISGTFELLPTCNMRCRMCYIQHTPRNEELQPVEFWIEVFEQALKEGLLFPLLTGGEPFLYPEFEALYEKIAQMPMHICINTNATLLDREKIAWLAKMPVRRLNISLYGASDQTYADLCGNPNGFTQVIHAFDLLKEYGIPFRVHSVMVPENVDDYQRIIEICNRYQVPLAMANYMFPAFRKEAGESVAEDRFTPSELAAQSIRYLRDHFIGKENEYLQHVTQRCMALEHPEMYSLYGNNQVACKAGKCVFWVDWRGKVSGCGIHSQGCVDLHTTTFKDAWKKITDYSDNIRISEKCKHCKYRCICLNCPASGFCETGRFEGTPDYLCAYCKEYGELLYKERSRLIGKL